MNRDKKCIMVSGLVHAALLSTFVIGSAFVSASKPIDPDQLAPLPTIHQIPAKLVDELIYNPGGAQEIGPVQAPQQPQPAPAPAAVTPPAKKVETPKVEAPKKKVEKPVVKPTSKPKIKTTETSTPKTPPKEKKPQTVDLSSLKVNPNKVLKDAQKRAAEQREAQEAREAEAAAAAAAEARQKWNASLAGAREAVEDASSGSTSTSGASIASQTKITGAALGNGDGTGSGEAVANYAQAVRSYYNNAWRSPANLSSQKPTTVVQIVVNRNGSIRSAKIITRSGEDDLDASVQRAIDSVVRLPAFPANSTDQTRTYILRFNMRGADF